MAYREDMRGAHGGPDGAWAGKNGRWLVVLASLAAVAGLIWFVRSGSALKWPGLLLILAVVKVVQSLVRGQPAGVWVGECGIILFGWEIISHVTHHPGGGLDGFLVKTAAWVCLGIGAVLLARETGLGRRLKAIRTRLASGPGDDGPAPGS